MDELPPLFLALVEAGFPSPAEDWIEEALDLNKLLIKRPTATYFLRVKGDSMIGAGIHEQDLLIVDRSIKPVHNDVVIASVLGDLTVKRLHTERGTVRLVPDNPGFDPIEITPEMDLRIWGVVTYSLHKVSGCTR
jgi:DNA polymerase V